MIVVDTNLLVDAVLPSESTALVDSVAERDPEWIAPSLWRREMANVLVTTMRTTEMSRAEAVAAFEAAERLVTDAEIAPSIAETLEIAERGCVFAYDAEFVAVAQRFELVLVTGDRELAQAFPGRVQSIDEFARGRSPGERRESGR